LKWEKTLRFGQNAFCSKWATVKELGAADSTMLGNPAKFANLDDYYNKTITPEEVAKDEFACTDYVESDEGRAAYIQGYTKGDGQGHSDIKCAIKHTQFDSVFIKAANELSWEGKKKKALVNGGSGSHTTETTPAGQKAPTFPDNEISVKTWKGLEHSKVPVRAFFYIKDHWTMHCLKFIKDNDKDNKAFCENMLKEGHLKDTDPAAELEKYFKDYTKNVALSSQKLYKELTGKDVPVVVIDQPQFQLARKKYGEKLDFKKKSDASIKPFVCA
jgi:hypothetical protein